MIIPVNNLGQIGLIVDSKSHTLPLNSWTDIKNMRLVSNAVKRVGGYEQVWSGNTIAPYYGAIVPTASQVYTLIASLAKVHVWDGGAYTDLTRTVGGDYGATADLNWTHALLSGVPVLNNGIDVPQMWFPTSPATKLTALTAWPVNTTAGSMRSFKNYLVALDITKASVRYPFMVKWSHPADPGAVPSSWDATDPTKDAGEYDLSETSDFCLDSLRLRDINVIYKENSLWGMQFIGGVDIFRFYRILGEAGALSRRCAAELPDGRHVVFGDDDCYVHDGQQAKSILTDKYRRYLYNDIGNTTYKRSFVCVLPNVLEVWFCYAQAGYSAPNKAVIWNWKDDTLAIRDLGSVSHFMVGDLDPGTGLSPAWNADSQPWDSDGSSWSERSFNPMNTREIGCVPGSTRLDMYEYGVTANTANMQAYVERSAMGIPFKENEPPDYASMKFMRGLWPRITGDNGKKVFVDVGGQSDLTAPIVWSYTREYTIGTTKKIDALLSTRLPALRFRSEDNFNWQIDGYELDIDWVGMF